MHKWHGFGVWLVLLGGVGAAQDDFNPYEVCAAHPRVDVQGILVWGENLENAKAMPYDLTCSGLHIWSTQEKVTVKADNVFTALATFTDEAFLLSYLDQLRVRYLRTGQVTADPVRGVEGSLLDDVFRIKVTVTPRGGQPQLIFKNAMPYPITLPVDQAFTVDLDTADLPNPWPKVEIDPLAGQVTATLGEAH